MSTGSAAQVTPFKGLAPFGASERDAFFFFGREREREIAVANLVAARLTVLYGPSGVGKTSLLGAGVAYALRELPDAAVVVLSSWVGDPIDPLRDAIEEAVGLTAKDDSLVELLVAAAEAADSDIYIILDQFEEYFLYHEHERGPGSFAAQFAEAVRRPGLRANFLIGIREDALAELDSFKALIPGLFANSLRLDRLDRGAGEAAIVGPVNAYNSLVPPAERFEVEPGLIAGILGQVEIGRVDLGRSGRGTVGMTNGTDRIEAPYLQLVLERLWEVETAEGCHRLRLDTLKRLGGATRIVEDHLERAMAGLSAREQDAAAAMYNHLVTPSGMKIAHGVSDLAGYAAVDEDEAAAVLRRLSDERIVRAGENGGASRYEIFHDVLADAVLAWRTRHQSERALDEAETRRRRAFTIATAALVALVVVAAIAVFALLERSREQKQARNAHAQQLAAVALTKLDSDPRASVRLALSAALLQPKLHEEEVLRNALTRDRERAVLRADGPVRTASFDATGKRILAAGDDGKARIYDRSGHLLATFNHGAPVDAAVFATRGGLVATGGRDGEVKVWRDSAAHPLATLDAGGGAVRAVAFDRRAARLYSVTSRGTIRGWSVNQRFARVAEIRTRIRAIGATLAGSGHFIVVIAHDRFARVYALPSERFARRLAQKGYIGNVAFSPDELLLLTNGNEGTVRLWRVGSWRLVRELRGPGAVKEAVFSRDGRLVAAASTDGTVRVWETATGFQLAVMIGHTNELTSVAFNPDASAVVSASTDGTARVWAIGGRPTSVLAGHGTTVFDATFSPDGNSVVTAGEDGTARLWDPGSEPELRVVAARRVIDVALTADGRRFATAGDGVVLWNTSPLHAIRRLSDATTTLAAISPDGTRVAAPVVHNRVVAVLDARNGTVLKRFRASRAVTAVGFDRANRMLAAAGSSIAIWDGGSLRTVHEVTTVNDLAASPDGALIATAGEDGNVRLRDARTWMLRRTLRGHKAAVNSVEFSPDGKWLLTASQDEDVRVWAVATGRVERMLHWHFGPVADAAFSPDGRWILTAGPVTAGIGLAAGQELFRPGAYLRGLTRPLTAVGFGGPNGRVVVAASKDGTLRTFTCDSCGDVHDLVALARRRLAAGT